VTVSLPNIKFNPVEITRFSESHPDRFSLPVRCDKRLDKIIACDIK